jgi:DNA polymerase III subunit chi
MEPTRAVAPSRAAGAADPQAAVSPAAGAHEVTFYVLDEASSLARLRFACRVTQKAYRAGRRVLIWHSDAAELAALDDLLWTFGDDRSFIPHERIASDAAPEAPVLLAARTAPAGTIEVLINLAADVPEAAARASRIIEIIDGEPERRTAGRARFKVYRDRGWPLDSHNVRG